MHMGDLLFNRAHPNIDRAQGARIDNWITILETVAKRASNDTIFIAGHAKDNAVRNYPRRADALPQLPDRGARSRARRRQGRTVEGRDPEAAGAEGLRRQRLAECAAHAWPSCLALPTTKSRTRSRNRPAGQQASQASQANRNNTHESTDRSHRHLLSQSRPLRVVRAGAAAADAGLHREVGRQRPARSAVVPADRSGHAVRTRRRPRRARERSDDVLRGDGDGRRLQDDQRRHDVHVGVRQRRHAARSAPSRLRRPTRTWCGSAPAKRNNRQSSSWGDGIYKSTDGGRSWKNMGLKQQQADRARSSSTRWTSTSSTSRRSAICGAPAASAASTRPPTAALTWNRVLHVDDDTGATELVMDPSNNKTLYTATYQRRRQQWGMNGGGAGSNIWKTTDGGVTWTKLESGIPGRTEGPHRPRRLSPQPERPLRARRARDRERRLSLRQRRRDLAQDEHDQPAADVLRRHQDRSANRLAHLRARRLAAHLRRWRPDVPRRRRRAHSRRSSRAVDQPEAIRAT